MKKHHWFLIMGVALVAVAVYRASGVPLVPAALCLTLWASECYSTDAHAYLKRERRECQPGERGKRAAERGLIPRIYQGRGLLFVDSCGRRLDWRCHSAGVTGMGATKVEAYDDWESQL